MTYAFGMLKSTSQIYKSLASNRGNFGELKKGIEEILLRIGEGCERLAKLYYVRDVVWSEISNGEVSNDIPELNYFALEGIMLLFEVMFANCTLLKIFVCHYNSETHNQMVNAIVTHTKNKIQAIEAIFDRYATNQHVEIKHFCQQSMIFMNFSMVFSLWNINKTQETYTLTRTKTFKQLNHENFVLGTQLLWFLGEKEDVPYFVKIIQDKHYN